MVQRISQGLTVTFGSFNAEVLDITVESESADTEEVTHQQSPDGYKEFVASFIDGGSVTLECLFDPAKTWPVAGEQDVLQIDCVPWTKMFQATAICTETGGVSASLGSRITRSLTFKITGKPEWVASGTSPTP